MPDPHKNFAASSVATAPSPATSGTSLVVASGEGARFPAPPFNVTLCPAGAQPTPTNSEIARVTAGPPADTFTIIRTTTTESPPVGPRAVVVGDQIFASITARALQNIEDTIPATYSLAAFGGVADATIHVADAVYVAADQVSSVQAGFSTADVGKVIVVNGGATPTAVTGTLAITSGATAFSVVGATFTRLDVGKWIALPGAGAAGATLYTSIATITNATSGTVAAAASTTVSTSQTVRYAGTVQSTIASVAGDTATLASGVLLNTFMVGGARLVMGTDNAPAFNAMIAAMSSGDVFMWPRGQFLVAGPLVVNNKGISAYGAGLGESILVSADPTLTNNILAINVDQAGKVFNVTWRDFMIWSATDRTAGAALALGNIGTSSFANIKIYGGLQRPYHGVVCSWVYGSSFDNIQISACAGSGLVIAPNASGQVTIDDFFGDTCYIAANLGDGILFRNDYAPGPFGENIQGLYFGAMITYANVNSGVHFLVANDVKGIDFRGTIIDSNSFVGFWVDGSGPGLVKHIRLSELWVSYNGHPGLTPVGASYGMYLDYPLRDFTLSNSFILLNGFSGLTLAGSVTRGKIQGCTIADNSQAGAGYYGIDLKNGTGGGPSAIQIDNLRVSNTPVAITQHGLSVESSALNIDIFGGYFDTGAGTTPRNVNATAGVREWGVKYGAAGTVTTGKVGLGSATDPTAALMLAAGVAAASGAPLKFTSGVSLTTPEAGAVEFDGTAFYQTVDTTNGPTQLGNTNIFRLVANGSAIGPTIADYFGATSSLPTVTNGVYELTYYLFYLKTTAGTVTYTLTNTQTYTNLVVSVEQSPAAGIGTQGAPAVAGIVTTTAAAAALPATASLTTGVNHLAIIKAVAECGTAGNIRLRVTSSAGTVTPLRGSYYTARRLFAGNVGIFAA